jgi:uncharacterized protein
VISDINFGNRSITPSGSAQFDVLCRGDQPKIRSGPRGFTEAALTIPMYIEDSKDGVILKVRVRPNSSKNGLTIGAGERLEVKLTAAPKEGKANEQLLKFMGKILGVAPSAISLLRGRSSRDKILLVRGMDLAAAKERLP